MGAHAHACSDGNLDCLQEVHAEAIVHAEEACADESCVDTTVEAADGVLAKLLDLDDGKLLAAVVLAMVGLLVAPRVRPTIEQRRPAVRRGFHLNPPARAPPVAL